MVTIYSLWLAIACIAEVAILRCIFKTPKFARFFYLLVILSIFGLVGRAILVVYLFGLFVFAMLCSLIGETPSGEPVEIRWNIGSRIKKTKLWEFFSN